MNNTEIVFFYYQLDYINKKPKHGRSEQRALEAFTVPRLAVGYSSAVAEQVANVNLSLPL